MLLTFRSGFKQLTAVAAIGICLSSCVSTQKYARFVDEKLKYEQHDLAQRDWLVVNTPAIAKNGNSYSQVKSSFIPAIVYWEWNSTIACEIDQQTASEYIKRGIYQAADKMDLQSRLGGKQLVIDIKQLPGQFLYENKGHSIILFVAHVTSAIESISPKPIDLVVGFQLQDDFGVLERGESLVANNEKPFRNVWKSTKKFTWMYLEEFEKEANRMGTESVKDIISKLDSGLAQQ